MGILRLGGFTAGVFAAAALVAGCGQSQPPVVTSGAAYQAVRQSDVNASNYKSLYSFEGPPDGEEPSAGLTGFKGLLYGTTSLGGYNGSPCNACGTVYTIMVTGKERVLYRFAGPPDGEFPGSNLSEANGVLFGTAYSGGSSSCSGHCGVVFKVNALGKERIVYAFTGRSDGSNPKGDLLWTSKRFYGTASTGGSGHDGTLFSLDSSGKFRTLHAFTGAPYDGAEPLGNLVKFDGALFGVTEMGGEDDLGSIFKLSPSGTEAVVHSFNGMDGQYPVGLVAFNGLLYGATSAGGPDNKGTLFSTAASGTFNIVHSFLGHPKGDGAFPMASPTVVNGVLYGTTRGGGAHGNGTVYELNRAGSEAVLHSFGKLPDGVHPFAPLVFFDGLLYGTTENGGSFNPNGTVFQILP